MVTEIYFDILNNKYQCCTNQIRISSNAANLLNYLCVSVNCSSALYLQTSTSVSQGHTLAALMPIATIPRGLTTVHVNLDSLGVEENARVSVTFGNIEQRRIF